MFFTFSKNCYFFSVLSLCPEFWWWVTDTSLFTQSYRLNRVLFRPRLLSHIAVLFMFSFTQRAFFRRVQVLWSLFRLFCRSRNLGRYMLFSFYCMLYSMAWCSLGAARTLSVKWPECEPDIREIHVGLLAEATKCPDLLWRPHSLIYSRCGTGGGGGGRLFRKG